MSLSTGREAKSACSPPREQISVLLRVEGLRKAFGGQVVLNGIDLQLLQGEVVLLRGENGSGKTTLLNILTGNLEPDSGVIHYRADGSPRSYHFPRRWWQNLNPFDHFTPEFVAQESMGRTWQDVRLFGSQTLRDNIALAAPEHPGENPLLALFAWSRSNRREVKINEDADGMLSLLGLAGRESSSADMISLGQSKRVAIARAVAAGARILFLDEPLAGLDHQGICDVIAFLKSLVHHQNLTLVIVEHVFNQSHLNGLVTTDWLLENGTLHRKDDLKENSVSFGGQLASDRPAWFELLTGDCSYVLDETLSRGARLTRIRHRGQFQLSANPALEIRDTLIYRGPRIVIGLDDHGKATGFSLTVYKGEIAILQAPNGWGKSTLFAAICGLVMVKEGKIFIDGKAADSSPSWKRIQSGLRALPSDNHSFPGLKAEDAFRLARSPELGGKLGVDGTLSGASLSGGQRQQVALVATIQTSDEYSILVLDEPFSAMDGPSSKAIAKLLRNLCRCGVLILIPSSAKNVL